LAMAGVGANANVHDTGARITGIVICFTAAAAALYGAAFLASLGYRLPQVPLHNASAESK